jgi:urease accessory protein
MKRQMAWMSAAVAVLVLTAGVASAHPGHDTGPAGAAGFAHPFTGWDHLLAMVAVGLWATQLGGKARWIVPASFLAAMLLGGAMAASDMTLRLADQGILASVLVLGVMVAIAARLPIGVAAAIVGLFAIFHGYAHVAEMPPGNSLGAYAPGFMLATALLLAAGLAIGMLFQTIKLPVLMRICGGAVAIGAVALWVTTV